MSTTTTPEPSDGPKWRYGLIAVALGILALLIALALVMWKWHDTTGIAALGVISSPIAAMVGAYFGVQVSAGAAKASEARADRAEGDKTKALTDVGTVLSHLDPSTATGVRSLLNFQ